VPDQSPDDSLVSLFVQACAATTDEAKALIREGFTAVEEIAYVPHWELEKTPGIPVERLNEIRLRARQFVLRDLE
jgi:transcription termination/antitermination protein NusA